MNRLIGRIRDTVIAAFCSSAVLIFAGQPARGQNSEKRCYTVQETFHKIHNLTLTPEIKPIKHCYSDKDHPYRYSVMDISVSLAEDTVRTPEFSPPTHWYWIMVEVEKPLATKSMSCMMAVDDDSTQSLKDCPLTDRLLRADWTVLEDGQVVKSGSSTTHADAKYTKDNIFKFLGSFPATLGHKYVVQVKFTKNGKPLDMANPHLIVVKQGDE